jgi:segregation and condensation protein B
MSLKAKLEAVIYAAEEPVTLAQLSALFAAEALEWKAEQAAARAAEAGEEAAPENAELPLGLGPEFEAQAEGAASADGGASAGGEAGPTAGVEVAATASEEKVLSADEETAATASDEKLLAANENAVAAGEELVPAAEEQPQTPEATDAEARKLARLKEREVRGILRGLIDELIAQFTSDERGVEIREIAGGYRMATKVECHDAVRMFVKSLKPAMKLSLPALETLAVIAYKQPVTAPEVNEIRGVDSSGVFGSLLARKLIATAGRKQVIGRPILYKTTREFLLRFGLKDVSELPSMEEFEKMAAAELEEPEAAVEATPEAGAEPKTAAEGGGEGEPEVESSAAEGTEAEGAGEEAGSEGGSEAEETAAEESVTDEAAAEEAVAEEGLAEESLAEEPQAETASTEAR